LNLLFRGILSATFLPQLKEDKSRKENRNGKQKMAARNINRENKAS
jgi:hypothetical protein